ncbi:enoyl-CoA hydratase-related protein [Octadecabacter sp. 1_MG-2023]|uniref:enoyl-CoA hydratase-related protein n=1 Tax=unclassified Octadecabacter TaxID=196158 RepID=UPI001C090AB8|nr:MULTISPECIES: enoyl-CoA hydratase-related protein [unclassified Octadecabacter]MBU2993450.1 enoyl-CoA hydratase/isomerase family protein [Octadecabacter sp. B2R22]MDO6733094.1 enoyl-CoA hydratase-related protein [Octadecabacter sp. 1_MG-2023]
MDYSAIRFEIANDVATLTLNRPRSKNALNVQMRAEIAHAVKVAESDARVLVIGGAGDAFCSGQDLGDGGNATSLDLERTLRDEYVPMLRAIFDCTIPTICAVHGAAAGAGANLALAADVVIAADEAYFIQAFTRIGLIPDAGGTYWLPRQMGAAKAMGAALFGDKITGRQAADWGMIYESVPLAEFDTHVAKRALHLAAGPTAAYARVKSAIRGSFENTLDEQLAVEAKLQGECGKTRDFQEGVLAFMQKRPAKYEGR